MKRSLIFFQLIAISLFASPPADDPSRATLNLTNTSFEVGYAGGNYISLDEGYTEFGLFSPVLNSNDFQVLIDAKGYVFNSGRMGASAGFGIRNSLCDSRVFGFNFFYDYIRSSWKKNYNQFGAGFEWFDDCFDVRVNGYLPFGIKTYQCCVCKFKHIGGDFFAERKKIEFAYGGFDAEVGTTLFQFCDFKAYGAAGPYWYLRTHAKDFWGGYTRLELSWKSYISLQGIVTFDELYHTNVQGIVRLSLPISVFGLKSICGCDDMFQPIRRNGVILIDHCCSWDWNWDD